MALFQMGVPDHTSGSGSVYLRAADSGFTEIDSTARYDWTEHPGEQNNASELFCGGAQKPLPPMNMCSWFKSLQFKNRVRRHHSASDTGETCARRRS